MSSSTPTPLGARMRTWPGSLGDRRSTRFSQLRARWPSLWPWAPLVFAGVYLILLLANFSSIINAINMSADVVVAPVIGKLLGSAPSGSHVVLGNHPWYEELWLLRATAGLPGYRQLWDVAPAIFTLLGFGLLAWSTWRTLGGRAAAITLSALVCLGAGARSFFFVWDSHGLTALHTIFLGAVMVWLVPRVETMKLRWLVVVALVAGAISVAPATGDSLFLYWALVPMVLTAALLAWRTRERSYWLLLGVSAAIAVIALVGGAALHQAMENQGWLQTPFTVSFVAPQSLVSNLVLLMQGYLYLGGGEFFGSTTSFPAITVFVAGVLILASIFALLVELRRRAASAEPPVVAYAAVDARRFTYVGFWAFSLVTSSVAYALSTAPVNIFTSRFLLAGYIAIGALLPLLAARSRGWQVSVVTGLCAFALIASFQIARKPFAPQASWPGAQEANTLVRLARYEHVNYGYASYWDAADLTWLTYFKLKIYPINRCAVPNLPPEELCEFNLGQIDSWYKPRPGTRSMLIIDPKLQPSLVPAADPAMGYPTNVTRVGNLEVLTYPYDIASHLHTPV